MNLNRGVILNKFKALLKSFLFEILMIFIIFLFVIIAGLVDLKSNEQMQNKQVIKDMSVSLENDKRSLENINSRLIKENDQIKKLKTKMNSANKDQKNSLIIQYNDQVKNYKQELDNYNEKVKRYDNMYYQYKSFSGKSGGLINWIRSVIGI